MAGHQRRGSTIHHHHSHHSHKPPEASRSMEVALLRPIRLALSKPARRAYLQTFLLLLTSLLLLAIAITSYALFYNTYIPRLGVTKPVHLHFPPSSPHPSATIAFAPSELVPDQRYDITLHLLLPASPSNIAHGNFNCDLHMLANDGAALLFSRRPAIMTYASPLVGTLRTLVASPLLVAGWAREQEALTVVLAEGAVFAAEPRRAVVEIDSHMAVYQARLECVARLSGLRWVMYHWRVASAVVMVALFWGTEAVYAVLLWYWVSTWLGRREVKVKEEEAEEVRVEEEKGRVLRFGDVQRTFPTSSRAPPLVPSYPTPETTPAPEREEDWTPESEESCVGDDEGEVYNEEYQRLVEAGRITADSGLGSTVSESTGRDTPGGSRRRRR